MTNSIGTLSYGVFATIVTEATNRVIRAQKKSDLIVENLTIYFVKPVQIDNVVSVHPKVLEIGRKFGKVDVEVHHEGNVVGKALLMVQLIDNKKMEQIVLICSIFCCFKFERHDFRWEF